MTDIWLRYLNSGKIFSRVGLKWSNFNFSDSGKMKLPIWQRCFCSVGCSVCITKAIHWSCRWHRVENGYSESLESVPSLQSYLEISYVGNRQHITGLLIYYRDMTFYDGWEYCVLLAAFKDKILKFHFDQIEHCLALGDGPLCAQHHTLIRFIWCCTT